MGLVPLRGDKETRAQLSLPHEDTVRKWPSTRQEEDLNQNPTLLAP